MKNPFLGLFRTRDRPRDAISAAPSFYFGSSVSGKSVNPKNAVQVSTIYACVRVIAETIASLPVGVYESTEHGSQKAPDRPLYHLLHDEPNPEMTSFVWQETMLSHLLLWSNSYSQIIRNGKTGILGLYPLLPDRMEVDRDSAGRLTYKYTTT
jgi:HK97 family phage portal protein